MEGRSDRSSGVAGTLDAFKFVRRVAFPSTPALISLFCTLVMLPGILTLPSLGLSLSSSVAVVVAVSILPALVGGYIISSILLRGDHVLDYRRLIGLELLSWIAFPPLLVLFTLAGIVAGSRNSWADGLILSIVFSLPIRFLAVHSISTHSEPRKALSAATTPIVIIASYLGCAPLIPYPLGTFWKPLMVVISSIILSATGVSLIVRRVEKAGAPNIGASPMGLFRSFVGHWLNKNPTRLEEKLASIGLDGQAETGILAFSSQSRPRKGCIVVTNIHPGPYRDLGSGGLPSLVKAKIESEIGGIAMVPHGISNHENNVISRSDINAFLHDLLSNYPSESRISTATRLVRETSGQATASAQAFGNLTLITLTLAPHEMEDIPHHVLVSIQSAAKAIGFTALAIDSHNSLKGQTSITPSQASDLTQAALKALKTVSQLSQLPFKLGMAKDPLEEYGLEDGIGPGGLSIAAVSVDGKLASYMTVDGNNMQTGLREVIIKTLRASGVNEGEVMTTDTHLVTGLVRSPLGYHPVGEGVSQKHFLRKIQDISAEAVDDLEDASVGFNSFKKSYRMLGAATFSSITSFVSAVAKKILRSILLLELLNLAVAFAFIVLL